MEAVDCRVCGGEHYNIKHVYEGSGQSLYIVECTENKCDVIPVLMKGFLRDMDVNKKCRAAWDKAQRRS
jgi:hypothetical protein